MSRIGAVVGLLVLAVSLHAWPAEPAGDTGTPILVYHHFGPTVADRMTVRTSVLQRQVEHLQQHGYTVVPLRLLVAYLRGEGAAPPSRRHPRPAPRNHEGRPLATGGDIGLYPHTVRCINRS
jgi:hypothetical protein